jgi:hypothetical protein
MIVSLVHAQQTTADLQSQPSIFLRLRRAHQGFFIACGGPRCAIFGASFFGGFSRYVQQQQQQLSARQGRGA